jgi:hypothetical protein
MFAFLALLVAGSSSSLATGYEPAVWVSDDRALACAPKVLRSGGTLSLTLGDQHGRELAIYRLADKAWYFLVVGSPDSAWPQLMTREQFAIAKHVDISATLRAGRADVDGPIEPVFSKSGSYDLYVSRNLESEQGGYRCRIKFKP